MKLLHVLASVRKQFDLSGQQEKKKEKDKKGGVAAGQGFALHSANPFRSVLSVCLLCSVPHRDTVKLLHILSPSSLVLY